jgi:hypothetical protein
VTAALSRGVYPPLDGCCQGIPRLTLVKRRDVIRKIAAEAKRQSVDWTILREGGSHTVYSLGGVMVPVARHTEIDEQLARKMFRECEPMLGEGWWRQ